MTSKDAVTAAPPLRNLLAVAVLLSAALIAGCGSLAEASFKSIGIAISGKPDIAPDPDAVAANRFAQIKVNGSDGGAILVLGNIDGKRQAWYSADRSIVFLQDGLVVATHGGRSELRSMSIEGSNPFHDLRKVEAGTTVHRRYDVMPGYHYGMRVTGTLQPLGQETLRILGKSRELLHIQETLDGAGWSTRNHYWVDPDNGFIWKSVQAISADASLEIVQLKPFSADLRNR
ncbi:YjbF family lipoprotein [Stenotrophomonas terrae]|uniref:YjbF family lipoprotein n=1 Tax=Stenotrophomonas terrae TaxID=405446 RepID=UPI00070AD3F1|nr:YjbF family lipoprotein [Stenotrophomonas terrae]